MLTFISYAVVIGDPASASSRLQFCQAWNGVASFIGPLVSHHVGPLNRFRLITFIDCF